LTATPRSRRRAPARLHVELVASQPALNQLLDQFEQFSRSRRVPDWLRREAHLVLDEIVSNIIAHGSRGTRRSQIDVIVALDARALTIVIADDGRPFNPMTAPKPELVAPISERPVGGLGVHLVRTLMDRVEYRRRQGRNELRLTRLVTDRDRKPQPKPRRAKRAR
jgi:anti-sigma regulatory factor (Ser/Thr protein kinase)